MKFLVDFGGSVGEEAVNLVGDSLAEFDDLVCDVAAFCHHFVNLLFEHFRKGVDKLLGIVFDKLRQAAVVNEFADFFLQHRQFSIGCSPWLYRGRC